MKRKGGLGFLPVRGTPTREEEFLLSLPLDGKVVYDVGAFEGLLTLFFSRRARQVVAFEPNPRNFAKCMENLRLNGLTNVRVIAEGVSDSAGQLNLIFDPLMPGAGSAEKAIGQQISGSVNDARTVRIRVLPIDEHIENKGLPAPDLVKIDIEGLELAALQGMERLLAARFPDLYIEMHGATAKEKRENAEGVLGFLSAHDYKVYDVENMRFLTVADLGEHLPSHLYCTRS